MGLELVNIYARDIPDAWFRAVSEILYDGHIYTVDRGSYEGQQRLEFDHVTIHIRHPNTRPLLPETPIGSGVPNPVQEGYLEEYLPYLMTDKKEPGEDYTYGERLNKALAYYETKVTTEEDGTVVHHFDWYTPFFVSQIEEVIKMFKEQGEGTNQACMEIGQPSDILLKDPPCLRLIDCRLRNNKLHFIVYFRSWDLWGGTPANLGAIQFLKEYMCECIGCEDGEIIASSKGLHLYDYIWDSARLITNYKGGRWN